MVKILNRLGKVTLDGAQRMICTLNRRKAGRQQLSS